MPREVQVRKIFLKEEYMSVSKKSLCYKKFDLWQSTHRHQQVCFWPDVSTFIQRSSSKDMSLRMKVEASGQKQTCWCLWVLCQSFLPAWCLSKFDLCLIWRSSDRAMFVLSGKLTWVKRDLIQKNLRTKFTKKNIYGLSVSLSEPDQVH